MIKLLGIIIAVISYLFSSLDAHVLPKREDLSSLSAGDFRQAGEATEDELRVRGIVEKEARENPYKDARMPNIETYRFFDNYDSNPENDEQEDEEEKKGKEYGWGKLFKKLDEYMKRDKDEYEDGKQGERGPAGLFNSTTSRPREDLAEFRRRENLRSLKLASEDGRESSTNVSDSINRKDSAAHFSYAHPEKWSLDNPECSGRLQSPINFDSDELIGIDVPSNLTWTGYWNRPDNLTVSDTGHSVQLKAIWQVENTPFITGGILAGDYVFAQLHFHWGKQNSVGSEHTIDNKSFPMEMHMVHYKRSYENFKNALNYRDGLTVVAFFFEMNEAQSLGLDLLADSLNRIQNKPGTEESVKPYPLGLFHSTFKDEYASYVGSLTTPPCREIVTWLVSARSLPVSEKQMDFFRKISNKWPGKENYRPKQPLNGRGLYYV